MLNSELADARGKMDGGQSRVQTTTQKHLGEVQDAGVSLETGLPFAGGRPPLFTKGIITELKTVME